MSDNTLPQDESRGADETILGETCCYVNQSQRGFRIIIPVEVKARGVAVQIYAFLDTGSEISFIYKDLFSQLQIQENPRPVNIVTISQHPEPFEKYSVNLTVSSLTDDSVNFKIREVVKADTLPVSLNAVISFKKLQRRTPFFTRTKLAPALPYENKFFFLFYASKSSAFTSSCQKNSRFPLTTQTKNKTRTFLEFSKRFLRRVRATGSKMK